MKIAVTGGSGFIGTNLIDRLILHGFEVVNFDIKPPRFDSHKSIWKMVDLCDLKSISSALEEFSPGYIVNLAAVTDIRENDEISHYSVNFLGVKNLVVASAKCPRLKRIIFASTMLVNATGPNNNGKSDYGPNTLYGKSKVMGENVVSDFAEQLPSYCIVRPTSIWGEWFGEPYKDFFQYVRSGRYLHVGRKSCTKTYGYVKNTAYQIHKLLLADEDDVSGRVFYLGDKPAINIELWANEIAECFGIRKPKRLPFWLFRFAGYFGDLLEHYGFRFPITSFRLRNMTTDNEVDLTPIYEVAGEPPVSRIDGVKNTVRWLRNDSR